MSDTFFWIFAGFGGFEKKSKVCFDLFCLALRPPSYYTLVEGGLDGYALAAMRPCGHFQMRNLPKTQVLVKNPWGIPLDLTPNSQALLVRRVQD